MTGHGGPRTSLFGCVLSSLCRACAWHRAGPLTALAFLTAQLWSSVWAEDLRLRVLWGGGVSRRWHATVSLSRGTLSELTLLGLEADEPGSIWVEGDGQEAGQKIFVRPRLPRDFDGFDVSLSAPADATLSFRYWSAEHSERPVLIEVPVANLSEEPLQKPLDEQGNRLSIALAPGEQLRVRFEREHLVFSPGEPFKFSVELQNLRAAEPASLRLRAQLLNNGKELWSSQKDLKDAAEGAVSLEATMPSEEGVYDLLLTATTNPSWSQAVRQPLNWRRTLAERRVQLLVLQNRRRSAPARGEQEFEQILEIDPASPSWLDKLGKLPQWQLSKARLPRLWKGPLENSCSLSWPHVLGDLSALKPNTDSPDVSWAAYWLPLSRPERPHIVEVEYPSDVRQTLGVCVLEENSAGGTMPLIANLGVNNAEELLAGNAQPSLLRHRLIFWPRTTAPLLLITNLRENAPAVYGKIRVFAGPERLPPLSRQTATSNRRLLLAYLDRPNFPANFSALEDIDPSTGRPVSDWRTFHESAVRLTEYLKYAGYNGAMLAVVADGSALYPSRLLQPNPRYDTGVFAGSGQDPVRKDILEMLLRLFDREELQLVPLVDFSAPLPELERLLRAGGSEMVGITWVGTGGRELCTVRPPLQGAGPYYNILHPQVQEAVRNVLRELITRSARHPSFAGISIRLSPDGYAQLPGPEWGFDDATVARFQRDSGLNVPGEGPQRFGERAAFLAQEPYRRMWLQWRAVELAKFYRSLAAELKSFRPDARLYLAGGEMLSGPALEAELRPALPRRSNLVAVLLTIGFDTRLYQEPQNGIVFLRPERIVSPDDLIRSAAELEIHQMGDVDRCFQGGMPVGSLFYHPAREFRLPSFERTGTFKPFATTYLSQATPAGWQNRRRFVRSLAALDAQIMVDGGRLLPMGEEEAVRHVVAAYRALPAAGFQTVGGNSPASQAQPVTFRVYSYGGNTYLYAVNDAPFPVTAKVQVEAGPACRLEELSGRRRLEGLKPAGGGGRYWEVSLEPYDLVAVRLSEPNVRCFEPHVSWPAVVETALQARIQRLAAGAAALRTPLAMDVVPNGDFERSPPAADATVPDWVLSQQSGVIIDLDETQRHGGSRSVRMFSNGPIACLVSRPLPAPTTGRLTVSVWLRVADAAHQPPLRLAVEGKLAGRSYYRYAPVGRPSEPTQAVPPILAEWGQYVFQVDDLPLEGLDGLRLRFDMMGEGEVWIDDVQVYSMAFNKTEMVELSKLITLADVKLRNGQLGDCLRLLEGYWPRFLETHVPLPSAAGEAAAASQPRAENEPPPQRSSFLDRLKGIVPHSLR